MAPKPPNVRKRPGEAVALLWIVHVLRGSRRVRISVGNPPESRAPVLLLPREAFDSQGGPMKKVIFAFLVAVIGLAPALAAAQGAGGGSGSGASGGASGAAGASGSGTSSGGAGSAGGASGTGSGASGSGSTSTG